jgi:predicted nucleotidyltransferase
MTGIILPDQKKLEDIFEKYNLPAVYLFGSRVGGTATSGSDYDFGILLNEAADFEEAALFEMNVAEELSGVLEQKADIVILNSASIELKFLIIKRGILIYSGNDDQRTDFEDMTIRDYLDFKPVLDTYRKEVRESIKGGGFYG